MTRHRLDADGRSGEHSIPRRALLTTGGAAGAALLAGCTGGDSSGSPDDADGTDTDDDSGSSGGDTGTFRLLVTDLPADIGDFDSLEVTLDRARVFKGDAESEADSGQEDGDSDEESAESDGADTQDADSQDADAEEGDGENEDGGEEDDGESEETDDGQRDFFWLDLAGATVDLTDVIGDKAVSVFEGELEAGSYSKVELHAAGIEGIVDGEPVDVKIPSEKLQIVHGFDIHPDEPVDFVFDIHVVKKGNGGYNLRPVISGSGVNGKDVDVEEIDADEDDEASGDDGDVTAEEGDDADNESAGDADNESTGDETGSE